MSTHIDRLVDTLGYSGDKGLLQGPSDFSRAVGCAHALHAAADAIKLQACFGAWEPGFGDRVTGRFVPIVYLAHANNVEEARRYHRWVWSQGLVPWLIIAVQERLIICPGFDFASEGDWERLVVFVDSDDLKKVDAGSALKDFAAVRLRSSLQWRDFRLQSAGTVDKRLLRALEHLHKRLASVITGSELPAAIVNRLIGRVLYTFLLLDRGVVPSVWAQGLLVDDGSLHVIRPAIALAQFWALQDRIDDIFNGAVFVLDANQRLKIRQEHLDLAIDYLRGGTTLHKGGEQTELFEIDLTAIQIETLSAVYEEFLRSESPTSVRNDGVVYTPPFLVDFVVNRLDDEREFSKDSRVLDPTAGSGVFLVAAFRRIVERVLVERRLQRLPMEELRQILVQCIYGVEKAASAAAVAAFSLYLNLLEYADPAELQAIVTDKRRRPKVFPPLIGKNILVADFFSAPRHFEEIKFTCVAGNPPWKPLGRVTTFTADSDDPVDGQEASEHITWLSLKRYLEFDGVLGLVMPSKSISSPSAKTFLTALGQTFHVRAIVNLSQWRRHLFENAEQPAALLFVSARAVTHASRTAFYSPALWTQPFTPKAMWTLAIDCSDVQWMPSVLVFRDRGQIFDAYALRPLDRAAKNRLRQAVSQGTATTFGELLVQLGLVSAGGSTPARTLLCADEICSINDFAKYSEGFTTLAGHPKQLSEQRLKACSAQHRQKFQGERLLVSRSLAQALEVGFPLAVNSSMNVIYWKDNPTHLTLTERATVLSKLGRFLMSDFARFQFALFGQLWQVDRTRVERRDLDEIAVPQPEYFLQPDDAADTQDLMEAMQVQDVAAAMQDYLDMRLQFENGLTPVNANKRIHKVPDDYLAVLSASLHGSFGTLFLRCSSSCISDSSARVVIDMTEPLPKPPAAHLTAFQFHDSARVMWTEGGRQIQVDKPAGLLNFSLDRAYGDALRVANLLLAAQ